MDGSLHRGRRVGAIVLGLLAIAAGALWLLFWLFGLAWVWPPELGIAVFLGVCFALGIAALLVGLFLVAGRFPGRRGWLVVGVVTLAPLALLAPLGLATSGHAADVDEVAAQALVQRTGDSNVAVGCVWEYDQAGAELWRCDMSSTTGRDMCFVWVTDRGSDGLGAEVDGCEGEHAVVARLVGREYRKLRGVSKMARLCLRESSAGAGGGELWSCDLEPGGDDGYCYATVTWRRAGRVNVAISHCEREVTAAVVDTYAKRSGTRAERAQCTEDHQNDGEWICDMGAVTDHDRCFVTFGSLARKRVTARISYCQREVVTAVNFVVERMYEKRTRFDDVSVACTLEEHEQWDCEIKLRSGRDRCDVRIERRAAGPRVDRKLTTCASGRM